MFTTDIPTMYRLKVPTLNHRPRDFDRLFLLWTEVRRCKSPVIIFDFSNCCFLRPNAVAFLGGLARFTQLQGTLIKLDLQTLQDDVKKALDRNGFLEYFGHSPFPWNGNSVPYQEFVSEDMSQIPDYLENYWLGRGWVRIDREYREEIIRNILELYANAFEHSLTAIGVFTCGQQFPNLKELQLSVIDFGIGIPANVRNYLNKPTLQPADALRWAFQPGHSTRRDVPGGDGLSYLKDFVRDKQGVIEIYSHDGYVIIDQSLEDYRNIDTFFEGTLINITVKCDPISYDMF